jgi:hypothetical protein
VKYGAPESNSTEAQGLALVILGLILFTMGWAYLGGVLQVVFVLVGIVAFLGGFVVLRMAREGRSLMSR